MTGGSFGYLVKQGINGAWLNRVMSLASVGILTACLIILGGVGLLSANVRDLFQTMENQTEVAVYVLDEATQGDITALEKDIKAIEGVNNIKFVSKADGLEEAKGMMDGGGYLLEGLEDDNPIPASFRITLNDQTKMVEIQGKIQKMKFVESVVAPTSLAETLTGVERTMSILGGIIIGILLIASLVVISNTIKLTVFARRREINIMKYVGATNGFIRLPFVVEGLSIGFISAILAFGVLMLVYQSLSGMLVNSVVPWINTMSNSLIPFWDVWYWLAGAFLISGMLIGSLASSAAMRKHLKV
ncbi:MAG: permease-like cell division protein FtsX [Oscillospiraceae bacterium]